MDDPEYDEEKSSYSDPNLNSPASTVYNYGNDDDDDTRALSREERIAQHTERLKNIDTSERFKSGDKTPMSRYLAEDRGIDMRAERKGVTCSDQARVVIDGNLKTPGKTNAQKIANMNKYINKAELAAEGLNENEEEINISVQGKKRAKSCAKVAAHKCRAVLGASGTDCKTKEEKKREMSFGGNEDPTDFAKSLGSGRHQGAQLNTRGGRRTRRKNKKHNKKSKRRNNKKSKKRGRKSRRRRTRKH